MKFTQHALLFSLLLVLFSCSKEKNNTVNKAYEAKLERLIQKYGFERTDSTNRINKTSDFVINENNVDEIEKLLENIVLLKKTTEQIDSIKKAYLENFYTQYGEGKQHNYVFKSNPGSNLRETDFIEDYEGPPFYFIAIGQGDLVFSAHRVFGHASYPVYGTINGWLISGTLAGSTTEKIVNDIPISDVYDGVQAYVFFFNGKLTASFLYKGIGFSVGYVITVQSFYNRLKPEVLNGYNNTQYCDFYVN